MLVIGRSYWVGPIQEVGVDTGTAKLADETTEQAVEGDTAKLADETTEQSVEGKEAETEAETEAEAETVAGAVAEAVTGKALTAGTKLMAYCGGRTAGTKTGAAFETGL